MTTAEETQSFLSGSTTPGSTDTLSTMTRSNNGTDGNNTAATAGTVAASIRSYDDLTYSSTSASSGMNPSSLTSEQIEVSRMYAYHKHRHNVRSTTMTTPPSYQRYQDVPFDSQHQQHQQLPSRNNVYRPKQLIDRILITNGQQQQPNTRDAVASSASVDCTNNTSNTGNTQSLVRCLVSPRVILTLAVCFIILGNLVIGSEFLQHAWELGISGSHAQHRANHAQAKIVVFAPALRLSPSPSLEDGVLQDSKEKSRKQQNGCESTIMLIRHCEKGSLRSHCSFLGYERSVYLAEQFGDSHKDRWPAPVQIYALDAGGRKHGKVNFREVETVDPLSRKVGVPINSNYSVKHTGRLATELLEQVLDGNMCGKLVVVSWKHSDIARLAQHLGCGPLQGCPWDYRGKDFDSVWQIRYAYAKFYNSKTGKSSYKWNVYGSVQNEGFDPLAFSKSVGDYPKNGTTTGTLAHFEADDFKLYG